MNPTTQGQSEAVAADADTMRAVTQDAYGTSGTWNLADIDLPEIRAKEVLVRVQAAGLDRGTWHVMTGRPYMMRAMGNWPGSRPT